MLMTLFWLVCKTGHGSDEKERSTKGNGKQEAKKEKDHGEEHANAIYSFNSGRTKLVFGLIERPLCFFPQIGYRVVSS